jgi:fucose permease
MVAQTSSEESSLLEDSDCGDYDSEHHVSPYIVLRVCASMYSFAVMGLFQSSVGVMLQPLSRYYSLSDLHVSLIFIVGPVGYVIAAQFSNRVHCTWGQRGVAILAPTLHILGALGIAAHPPFGVVLVALAAMALGTGLLDGSWCAWAAGHSSANTVSGMLQGSFSVGAAAGPFLAGTILPAWNKLWYDWYYVLVSSRDNEYSDAELIIGPSGRNICVRTMFPAFRIQTRKCIKVSA